MAIAQNPEAVKYAPRAVLLLSGEKDVEAVMPMLITTDGQQHLEYVPGSKIKEFMDKGGQPIRSGDILAALGEATETITRLQAENGGGIVFHIDSTGNSGLEARPATEVHEMAWPAAVDYAASLVRTLGPGWRLPTIEELQLLHSQKQVVGGFDRGYFHWSLNELDGDRALSLVDNTGGAYPLRKRGDAGYVRAIRKFGPDDPVRTEETENVVRVEPHERIVWSKPWQYNFDKDFSQRDKDEILQGIRTIGLTPDPKIARGYHMVNGTLDVFVYLVNGVWEINGATRK